MKIQMRLPMDPSVVITDEAADGTKNQWLTVLFGGISIMGVIVDSAALTDGHILWVEIDAEDFPGLPSLLDTHSPGPAAAPEPAEVSLDWSQVRPEGTHINCPHDPSGMNLENAMVCDGPR